MNLYLSNAHGEAKLKANKRFSECIDNSKNIIYMGLGLGNDLVRDFDVIKEDLEGIVCANITIVNRIDLLVKKDLNEYSAIYIPNTDPLFFMEEVMNSGAHKMISQYLQNGGKIFVNGLTCKAFECIVESILNGIVSYDKIDISGRLAIITNYEPKYYKRMCDYSLSIKTLALPLETTVCFTENTFDVIGEGIFMFEKGEETLMKSLFEPRAINFEIIGINRKELKKQITLN